VIIYIEKSIINFSRNTFICPPGLDSPIPLGDINKADKKLNGKLKATVGTPKTPRTPFS